MILADFCNILLGSSSKTTDAELFTAWVENTKDEALIWCSGVLIGKQVVSVANYCVTGVKSSDLV